MTIRNIIKSLTKSELSSILRKLKDQDYRSGWKKSQLIEQVLQYDNKTVLKVFTSNQLKEGLKLAGESTSGTKAVRLERLSSVWVVPSPEKSTDRPSNSIKIEALIRQGKAFLSQGLLLLESMDEETQTDILERFDAKEIEPYSNRSLFKRGLADENMTAKENFSSWKRPAFEIRNLALILHLHTNSSALQTTTAIDIIATDPIPMTFWTTLIEKAPHIKTIRVLLEPIPEIDVAYELKPFICIETENIVEKLIAKDTCAEWSLEDFALIEEMPWIEDLTLTSDPNQVRPSFLEKFDCYVMASRHNVDPFPLEARYTDWFWERKSYVDLSTSRCPNLKKVVIKPNQTLMSLKASTPSLIDIELQT